MRTLTSDEVRQARIAACDRAGVSSQTLMQAAGYAVTQFCLANFKFNSVCIVCGKGATGSIGLMAEVALRSVADRSTLITLGANAEALEPETAELAGRATGHPAWIASEADLESAAVREALTCELIIDAIAGADGGRPLTSLERKAIAAINDAFGTVVSVDLPSGADPDSRAAMRALSADAVFAHGVIALVAPRPAHVFGELTTGPIAVSEIGVQPVAVSSRSELQVVTGQEVAMTFPPRASEAHKGDFGHVLVIGGSRGKAGAAALAGLGALRAGAGLVTVACPASVQATIAGFAPELMTEGLPETADGAIATSPMAARLLDGKDVVVLGPGLSRNEETAAFARAFVAECGRPLVLDADGLNAFAGHLADLKRRPDSGEFCVLTPHPGEAARLLDLSVSEVQSDRAAAARRLADETGACVVLKGRHTLVAGSSGENWINLSGNAALAKGGSGDVLSGMIAAALTRRRRPLALVSAPAAPVTKTSKSWLQEISGIDAGERIKRHRAQQLQQSSGRASAFLRDAAVAAAVHLHGIAGDVARDHLHENTVLASDVMAKLSEAFRECELQVEQQLFYLQK